MPLKYSLVVAVCCLFSLTAFSQRPTFPELTQLQGPQKPRVGFIVQAGAKSGQDEQVRAKLKQVVDAASASLKRGSSSAVVARSAMRTLTRSKLFGGDAGVVVLDKKGRLASLGPGSFAGKMCAAAAIGSAGAAASVCDDVERHAVTVKMAVDGLKGAGETGIGVMDKFGNMAFAERPGVYQAYLAADGKAVFK